MKRNEQITPINSDQKPKRRSISVRQISQSNMSATLPKLQQTNLSSTLKSSHMIQQIRPQTGKQEQKYFSRTALIRRPVELDVFMKSARRVDYNCQSIAASIRQVKDLDKQDDPEFVPEYIDCYVRGLMSNDAALLIQSRFRLYVEKKNWKGLIHHRIWNRLDALRRIFVGWHGYVSKDITVIHKCYDKFSRLFKEKPWLSRKQTLSPFRLFYLNGRWFYPKHHDPRDIYIITRLFEHSNARRFLMLWKSISHSIRQLRPWRNKVRFTNKKIYFYGSVFNAFHVWNRYTKWKKLSKQTEKTFYLNCTETIILWNILERRLNDKKMQQLRANRASIKRIKKKAYNALYQKYVDHLRSLSEFESSYKFYLNHLQHRARNAWSVFMTLQHAKRVEMKKIMKSWYTLSFQSARIKNLLLNVSEYFQIRRLATIFHAWQKEAHELKLIALLNSFKLQEKPSTPYYIIFKMMKQFEFYFFIRVWKEWLEFTRRRKFWKYFALNYSNFDNDYELKQKVLYNLMFKLNYYSNRQDKFIMNLTPYSFIGMLQTTKRIKKSMNPNESDKDDELQWKFITQRNKENDLDLMNSDLLARSFLFAICKQSQTGISISKMSESQKNKNNDKEEENEIIADGRIYSFQELNEISISNRKTIRKKLLNRISHDSNIFNAVCSHFSAIKFQIDLSSFSLVDDVSIIQSLNPERNPFEIDSLNFSKSIYSSIENLIEENKKPKRISPYYKIRLVKKMNKFNSQFKFPTNLLTSQIFLSNTRSESVSSSLQNLSSNEDLPVAKQSTNTKNFLISTYKTPPVDEQPFPISDPKLNEIRQLKETTENTMMFNTKITKVSNENTLKTFGVNAYREKIMNMSLDDMLNGLRRFFFNMSDIRIDISKPMIYSKEDENSLNIIPVENRHQIRRRINAFMAEMCGFDISKTVPLYVDAEKFVYDCISTIFTVFIEMTKHKETAKFCDSYPFPEFVQLDSQPILSVRSSILSSIFEKFPKLAKQAAMMNFRMPHKSAGSHDSMQLEDANISVLLLPHIFKPELIKNFLQDKQYEKALKAKKENPNLASTSSIE